LKINQINQKVNLHLRRKKKKETKKKGDEEEGDEEGDKEDVPDLVDS